MKKIMIALAVAVVAVASQAASFTWTSGTVKGANTDGSGYSGSNIGTGVSAVLKIFANDSATDPIATFNQSTVNKGATKSTTSSSDAITYDTYANGGTTYYAQLILTDAAGNQLASSKAAFTGYSDSIDLPSLNFASGGGFIDGGSKFPSSSEGGWTPAPEPTSGLLLLLGVGVMALRRRRA